MTEDEKAVKVAFERAYKQWSDTEEKPSTMLQHEEIQKQRATLERLFIVFQDLYSTFKEKNG